MSISFLFHIIGPLGAIRWDACGMCSASISQKNNIGKSIENPISLNNLHCISSFKIH